MSFPIHVYSQEEEYEDTVTVFNDGADTINFIDDSAFTVGRLLNLGRQVSPIEYEGYNSFKPPGPNELIHIQPGSHPETINKMLYGINLSTGIFSPTTLPDGEIWTDQQWQWLSDLKPEILRFPGGDDSEFMHLLKNPDGTDAVGYGYDIQEIYKYYDKIDGEYEPKSLSELEDVDTDYSLAIENLGYEIRFEGFRDKYLGQSTLDHRYIDDFIKLIKKIEMENSYKLKVIVCLNITTETAARCKEIVQYLRNEITNLYNYPVLVEGVEMGNEYGDDFHCRVMGISEFNEYYDYLFGENNGDMDILNTTYGVSSTIYNGHNFMEVFKGSPLTFSCKVGLDGAPLLSSDGVFRTTDTVTIECETVPAMYWNEDLRSVYSDRYPLGSGFGYPKTFDAVILHPYYSADNFANIPIDELGTDYYTTEWDFDTYDTDLYGAFDGIISEGIKKNFRNFMRTTYLDAYEVFNEDLEFNLPPTTGKALWTTEWNIKDNLNGGNELQKLQVGIYTNGFMHGMLIQEWYLKNIKLNFQSPFRKNFFTISTIQSYAGGASTALLTPADGTEIETLKNDEYFEILGIDYTIFNNLTHWYVKRTPMFATELLSVIRKNNLQYLPTSFYLEETNINLQPTLFINQGKTKLYVFYTNVKSEPQNYRLNFTYLAKLWPGALGVSAGVAQRFNIDAAQCYSSAGKSSLFDICNCYSADNLHEFELRSVTGPFTNVPDDCYDPIAESENRCLTAPANSFGYFMLNVTPTYLPRFGELNTSNFTFTIFPNPASEYIYISGGETPVEQIEIYSAHGKQIATYFNQNVIDISNLAKGFYITKINSTNVLNFVIQ